MKKLIDKILIYVFRKLIQEYQSGGAHKLLHHYVAEDAIKESAAFVNQHLKNAMLFRNEVEIQKFSMERIPNTGIILEFGVASGKTINVFGNHLNKLGQERELFGFDSFEGLREDFTGTGLPKGSIDYGGKLPKVPGNVTLFKGWIQDTLEPFLESEQSEIAFVHVDTDTYETGRYILEACKERMGKGGLILFDDFICTPNWKMHSYKALTEVYSENEYEYIAFATSIALIKLL